MLRNASTSRPRVLLALRGVDPLCFFLCELCLFFFFFADADTIGDGVSIPSAWSSGFCTILKGEKKTFVAFAADDDDDDP